MCTLALYLNHFAPYPLVIAANRDELYDRPATAPSVLAHDPWVVAGQDLVAGGTWLGVNEAHLVVGLLNRRSATGLSTVDPTRRSRGLLALEMLHCRSLDGALTRLQHERGDRYNGFNLLLATPATAVVAHNDGDRIAVSRLDPGVHLLTNLDLNDPTCPRIAKSARLFQAVTAVDDPVEMVTQLQPILADHSTPMDPRASGPSNNLCVHTPRYGTCSASILTFVGSEAHYHHWYAAGAPCTTRFSEVALPN